MWKNFGFNGGMDAIKSGLTPEYSEMIDVDFWFLMLYPRQDDFILDMILGC